MSEPADRPVPPRRRSSALAWLLVLVVLLLAGGFGWHHWQGQRAQQAQAASAEHERAQALDERLDALRRDQRAQTARLQQAEATNRLLRDEVLGLGQRAALVEDTVHKLSDPARSGAQALRLDEVELLLAQGQQRLLLAGDLDGARSAYALAAQLLDGVADPAWLNLRQALTQERAALDALGGDPRAVVAGRLEAFAAGLPALPLQAGAGHRAPVAWWERAFAKIVEVHPSADAVAVEPADRAAGLAALRLELTLAHAAVERRDADGYRAALTRADGWIQRLWPASNERDAQRRTLQALRELPLTVALPTLGSTLEQMRKQRSAG